MLKTLELLSYGFDIIAIALVLTIVTMALLYCLLMAIGKQYVSGIPFYASGVMLFLMLLYQNFLAIGAFYSKELIDDFHEKAVSMVQVAQSGISQVEDYQASIDEITSEFPLLVPFINTANENVVNMQEWVETTTDGLHSTIKWFILRRIIWSSVFILLAMACAILVGKTDNVDTYTSSRHRRSAYGTTSSRRHEVRSSRRNSYRRRRYQ